MFSQELSSSNSAKGPDLQIASLPTIDYEKLVSGDDAEITRLVDICKTLGFFYLNLNGEGQCMLNDSRRAFQFMKEYFDQPLEAKLRDTRQSVTHG
jgi:isopenicillin N synthase-like dioxygenase